MFIKVFIVTSFTLFMLLVVSSYQCNADGIWKAKNDTPIATAWFPACEFNGKIYLFGSLCEVQEYDPETDKYTEKTRGGGGGDYAAVLLNDKIYATDHWGGMYEYDPSKDIWVIKAKSGFDKRGSSISAVNGKIYAIGGATAANTICLSVVQEYDPTKDSWTRKKDLPLPLAWNSACTVDDKIYVFGGWNGGGAIQTVMEYDPNADKWTKKTDMPDSMLFLPKSAPVINGKVYVIGGYGNNGLPSSEMQIYDLKTDTWTKGPDMPTARYALATTAVNGVIYAFCGATGVDFLNNQMWVSKVEGYDTGEVVFNQAVDANGKATTSWGMIKK